MRLKDDSSRKPVILGSGLIASAAFFPPFEMVAERPTRPVPGARDHEGERSRFRSGALRLAVRSRRQPVHRTVRHRPPGPPAAGDPPHHIGNGWFGGLLPATSFAMVASTGDIYFGLWYPVIFALITVVVGLLFLVETKDRDINYI